VVVAKSDRVEVLDTSLRDGSQGVGVSFSLRDKLRLTEILDSLGFDYVEGGGGLVLTRRMRSSSGRLENSH
jgi:Isopropylmalate/homocitrate/citramalate synthases